MFAKLFYKLLCSITGRQHSLFYYTELCISCRYVCPPVSGVFRISEGGGHPA